MLGFWVPIYLCNRVVRWVLRLECAVSKMCGYMGLAWLSRDKLIKFALEWKYYKWMAEGTPDISAPVGQRNETKL